MEINLKPTSLAKALLCGAGVALAVRLPMKPILLHMPGPVNFAAVNAYGRAYPATTFFGRASWTLMALAMGLLTTWVMRNSHGLKGILWVVAVPFLAAAIGGFVLTVAVGHATSSDRALQTLLAYTTSIVSWTLLFRIGLSRVPGWTARHDETGRSLMPSILRAPNQAVGATGVLETQGIIESPARLTARLVAAFEASVARRATHEVQARSVLYLDGIRVVPLAPDATDERTFPAEVRSTAYRVRRGLDEYWFVLHCKLSGAGCTFQLDARPRSRNALPAVAIGVVSVIVLLALVGGALAGVAALAIPGLCGLAMFIQFFGLSEVVFNPARGQNRRDERISEYLTIFQNALADAVQVQPTFRTPEPARVEPRPVAKTSLQNAPSETSPTPTETVRPRKRRD